MLYARCAFCGSVIPLMCSGSFMPHPPVYVAASPMGAFCSMCGVLPPYFMCMTCGTQQYLVLPGTRPPAMPAGMSQNLAAVVQASPGQSQGSISDVLGKIAAGLGKGAMEGFMGAQQQ